MGFIVMFAIEFFWNFLTNTANTEINQNLLCFYNETSTLSDEAFIGMNRIRILYLSDNRLSAVPTQIFKHMPSIEVLNLARNSIHSVASGDFQVC